MGVEIDRTAADGGRRGGRETDLASRGKRDVKPFLVEIGIAVALSFAAFFFRPRLRTPPPRSPSPRTSSPDAAETETTGKDIGSGLEEESGVLKIEEALEKTINGTSTIMAKLSASSDSLGGEEGFLMPELDDSLMEEFEATSMNLETTELEKSKVREESAMEQEIRSLRELVSSLQEREKSLELQLLDYHGQAAAVRELENRLKISAMETKLYMLKMESLSAENQRLQAQLVDHSRVMNELEAAKAKIELLSMKLKSNGEQAKEIMASLQQRISSLQHMEQKDIEKDSDLEMKLKRLNELEDEAEELRKANSRLAMEKLDLARKLESTQVTVSPVLEGSEAEAYEESKHLKKMNEKLMEEIEQLQTDRCADVEELVYLRWINACLRYELRNYQPSQGKTTARDLSKCLSPKSEVKAKRLILEYANLGPDEKSSNLFEVDSEYSSSSQGSTTGEQEYTSVDASSSSKRSRSSDKEKIISKIKKLVLGKNKQNNKVMSSQKEDHPCYEQSERRPSLSICSVDDAIGRGSYDSSPSFAIGEYAATNQLAGLEAERTKRQHMKDQIDSRLSLDIQILQRLNLEEARHEVPFSINKEIPLLEDILINYGWDNLADQEDFNSPEESELKKFADALRSSRKMSKLDRRSSSCG